MRIPVLIIAASLAFAPAAFATEAPAASAPPSAAVNAQVRQVLESAKLIGEWGVDCNAMASSTEWETIAVNADGVVQSIEGGDDSITTYNIVEARRLNSRDISMKMIDVDDDSAITVIYRVEANRQMTWSSVSEDGAKLITEGRFEDGEMGKWYARCPAGSRPAVTPTTASSSEAGELVAAADPAEDVRKARKP